MSSVHTVSLTVNFLYHCWLTYRQTPLLWDFSVTTASLSSLTGTPKPVSIRSVFRSSGVSHVSVKAMTQASLNFSRWVKCHSLGSHLSYSLLTEHYRVSLRGGVCGAVSAASVSAWRCPVFCVSALCISFFPMFLFLRSHVGKRPLQVNDLL